MDPLADKLLVSAALIFLIGHGVEAWMVFVIVAREFAVMGLRILAAVKKVNIYASNLGKLKTISQIIGVIAVLLNMDTMILIRPLHWWLMLIATLFTIISGIDYFFASKRLLND